MSVAIRPAVARRGGVAPTAPFLANYARCVPVRVDPAPGPASV